MVRGVGWGWRGVWGGWWGAHTLPGPSYWGVRSCWREAALGVARGDSRGRGSAGVSARPAAIQRSILAQAMHRLARALGRGVGGRRRLHTAIPTTANPHKGIKVDMEGDVEVAGSMVHTLERLSLVDFADHGGVVRLGEAVRLAAAVVAVDTEAVAPLHSTLEQETLVLRPDAAEAPGCRPELMATAAATEEDYYVAPTGNVPLSVTNTY